MLNVLLQSYDSIQLSKCQTFSKGYIFCHIGTPDSATKIERLLYVVNSELSTLVRNEALDSNWQILTKTVCLLILVLLMQLGLHL